MREAHMTSFELIEILNEYIPHHLIILFAENDSI